MNAMALADVASRTDYGLVAAERMAALMREGKSVHQAAETVKQQMLSDGSAWEFFAQHGEMLVADYWRRHGGPTLVQPRRRQKRGGAHGSLPAPAEHENDPDDGNGEFAAGELDAADSLYAAPLRVDGVWTTLGSMNRQQCRVMQFFLENKADEAKRKAEFFKKLATALAEGQTVRKRWSEYQLRMLLVESGA